MSYKTEVEGLVTERNENGLRAEGVQLKSGITRGLAQVGACGVWVARDIIEKAKGSIKKASLIV
ncbi:hypothetical protein JMM81_21630 [Bacillus sp. V3B]|uniref:hypothetical protein n=1 Tax=Bacillus sp. V3B TaxID=2804915 RepID=UPI00210E188A|nr:hypothetical protein [Bacillus sp. V3B]MCQ6277465.1 hypothetical protein [Bacillus sp. V3B]